MGVRHASLVIARVVYDMVEIPGHDPLVVAKDTGDEAARRWWDEHERAAAAQLFEQTNAAWQRQLSAWHAGTDIEYSKERLHDGGPRMDVARIKFPNGTESVVAPEAAEEYVAEAFRAEHPPPIVAAQFATWRETVQIAELRTWAGWLFDRSESLPLDMGLPTSQFGYPIREVLGCLDRLSAEGWQVVHVSEDRGRYTESDAAHESGVTTARYLLSRPG